MNSRISIYLFTYSLAYLFLALVVEFVHKKDVRDGRQPLVGLVGLNERWALNSQDGHGETSIAHYVNSAITLF